MRVAAGELVGLRQQRPLGGRLLDLAGQQGLVAKALDDLQAREAFRNREDVLDRLARDDDLHRLAHAHARRKGVFAEAELVLRAIGRDAELEDVGVVDHAGARQIVGDLGDALVALDHDGRVLLQRTRPVEDRLAPIERAADRERREREKREDAAEIADQRAVAAASAGLRLLGLGARCPARRRSGFVRRGLRLAEIADHVVGALVALRRRGRSARHAVSSLAGQWARKPVRDVPRTLAGNVAKAEADPIRRRGA
jgi:hypothetical protein